MLNKSMVIYLLTNTVNGKQYIGQTHRRLATRINRHRNDRRFPIGKAIQKYGWEVFNVAILEECKTSGELNEREIYWIATLNTKFPNGYNLTDGGSGSKGTKHSEESKSKMAAIHTGTTMSEETRLKMSISHRGRSPGNRGKKTSSEVKAKMSASSGTRRAVRCVETNEIFPSMKAAADWAGINPASISAVFSGKTKTAGKYHWETVGEYHSPRKNYLSKPKSVICVETNQKFDSLTAAAKWARVSVQGISAVLTGVQFTAGGYHWKVTED